MKTKQRDLQGEVDAGTVGARHDEQGREILDDRPISVPLRFRGKAISSYQDAQNLLKLASRIAEREGFETEEEANDFSIPEEEGFEGEGSSVFTEQDEVELLAVRNRFEAERARREKSGVEKPTPKKKEEKPAEEPEE